MKNFVAQAGAIPLRVKGNSLEVLLVTTMSGKNLTIPKGLIDPGWTAPETAANEAYEEAGVRGRLIKPSLGAYRYHKWNRWCEVEVFAMEVTRVRNQWPEDGTRRRVWVEMKQAAGLVKHAGLRNIILKLPKRVTWK